VASTVPRSKNLKASLSSAKPKKHTHVCLRIELWSPYIWYPDIGKTPHILKLSRHTLKLPRELDIPTIAGVE